MGDVPNSFSPSSPPPPSHSSHNSDITMLYYGLAIVGSAAILLAAYNLVFTRWCLHRPGQGRNLFARETESQSFECPSRNLLCSFKYKKGNMTELEQGGDNECAICLSAFEDGEEVRQLPRCKHSFHAACIDMWLYSHSDCPICRAYVGPSSQCHQQPVADSLPPVNSQEILVESGIPV
ncbi:hypothetical protein K2173_004502 [Erythroxylum novogranatense]|uniref:RING-type E3 ubiquitin transferase n=1 Tax=Erythroxylum novogranatense TaxID=1862640 RepID=A0AAV8TIT4_9ROSI|nr:hypothetical protein K2173_004502 [Erythroxylum novogranatense]